MALNTQKRLRQQQGSTVAEEKPVTLPTKDETPEKISEPKPMPVVPTEVKEHVKPTSTEAQQKLAKEIVKDQEIIKEAPKEAPKEITKEVPKEIIKEVPKEIIKEIPKEITKEPKDTGKEQFKENATNAEPVQEQHTTPTKQLPTSPTPKTESSPFSPFDEEDNTHDG